MTILGQITRKMWHIVANSYAHTYGTFLEKGHEIPRMLGVDRIKGQQGLWEHLCQSRGNQVRASAILGDALWANSKWASCFAPLRQYGVRASRSSVLGNEQRQYRGSSKEGPLCYSGQPKRFENKDSSRLCPRDIEAQRRNDGGCGRSDIWSYRLYCAPTVAAEAGARV